MTPPRKRSLLWDWTNTAHHPNAINAIDFSPTSSPICSLSNWNVWTPPELQSRVPFRPTVRTIAQLTDEKEWAMVRDAEEWEVAYFLNEPERQGVAVEEAGRWWAERMVGLRDGGGRGAELEGEEKERKGKGKRKLCSPACASDEAGEKWLREWMGLVEATGEDKRPDFVGVHYYGTKAEEGIKYLEKIHALYPRYPLIISEIACISRDPNEVWAFTAQMTNWMDECPWVFEYAFFGCMAQMPDEFVSPAARLMDEEGVLTELGTAVLTEVPIRMRGGNEKWQWR